MSIASIMINASHSSAAPAVYTFEMWGAGGGGGGVNWSDPANGGGGGSGAFVSGTITVPVGTELQLRNGGGGKEGGSDTGSSASNSKGATGGNGGNGSAIRIVSSNTLIAAAGGGGGGGSAGTFGDISHGMSGMGGRDSNQNSRTSGAEGANVNSGDGGSSGTNNGSLAGQGGAEDGGDPASKSLLMQDGGYGSDGDGTTGDRNANDDVMSSPWGGNGGRAGAQFGSDSGKGLGGGGGGGYTGGGGGGACTDTQDRGGGGGGGGGSYHNTTYVSSVTTEDGAGDQSVVQNAPTQTAGSSAAAWPSSGTKPGQGGNGANGNISGAPTSQSTAGEQGLVVLYRNGVEVARADASSGETQSYITD